jgi:Uncharacterized protein conserved in bacteria (DUF2330)
VETPSDRLLRGLVLLLGAGSLACAPAGRMGEEIHIAEESAIIIWDAAAKTQHFIRRASFETKAKDFGFLVPTPTVPQLAEADDEAFEQLKRITAPPVRQHDPMVKSEAPKAPAAAKAPQVVVVATAKVAGYDAAVLEATDAGALDAWLKSNGYASSPELQEWYSPYIAQRWKITAFKVTGDASGATKPSTSAVRMSFATEQPFFPYREPARPATAKPPPRMLRIYLLADGRYHGRIGAGTEWPGSAVWSNRLNPLDRDRVLKLLKLPLATAPDAMHLTELEDRSTLRPGREDLFLAKAADQTPLEKAPVYMRPETPTEYYVSAAVFALILLGVAFWLLRFLVRLFRSP